MSDQGGSRPPLTQSRADGAQKRPAFIDDRGDGGEYQGEAAEVRSGPFWFVLEQS